MPSETLRLGIGNLSKAVLVTGQAYQDPKDALNEFVSNAADEYAEAGIRGGLIRIFLHRRGRYPVIAIEDAGRGMDGERLRALTKNLFESSKADDPRTLGEKAIGLLAFQQLGGRCHIITRPRGSATTYSLRLTRGSSSAKLDTNERRKARQVAGTTAYIADLDPDVLRVLTQKRLVNYLRRRRGAAIARGDYAIDVIERKRAERVTPEEPDGVKLDIPPLATPEGRIEFSLYVSPHPDKPRRVSVVGRAGTTVIDDLSELEEFADHPWSGDQVAGQVVFEALRQTAGRRALLRDRDAFPIFVRAVAGVEALIVEGLDRVAAEVNEETADRLADAVRRIFGRVLRELSDLDNPMRTPAGEQPGDAGLLTAADAGAAEETAEPRTKEEESTEFPDLETQLPQEPPPPPPLERGAPDRRYRGLPNLLPDPNPNGLRSRFDEADGIVYYNDRHPDYLFVKDDEATLLDYLATLVAKEYVVYNNPRVPSQELAEEMVRMLVRVRHQLIHRPRKGKRRAS